MAQDAEGLDAAKGAKARVRGILLMILCTLAFALMDGLSKLLIETYPVNQIMFIRYGFFLLFVIALTRPRNVVKKLAVRRPWYQVLRAGFLVADQVVFILGLSFLALADAHVLVSAAPLLVAALSVPLLGERVGPRRWVAVFVGFLGVVFVLHPEGDLFRPAALFPLIAAIFFALYQIMTRVVSRSDSQESTFLYTALIGMVAFALAAPFDWVPPDRDGWTLLAAVSIVGCAAHILLIKALALAPAALLQPFFYMILVWAVGIGYLMFDDLPAPITLAGAAAIIGAGLYTLHREHRRKGKAD
ncbi:MAG: DMT family transporter [Pseudomonadota bacterium]